MPYETKITGTAPAITVATILEGVTVHTASTSGVTFGVPITAGGVYPGGVRQIVSSYIQAVSSTSTQIPSSNAIPQNTQGAPFLSVTITPKSATSSLFVLATVGVVAASGTTSPVIALFRDSSAGAFAASITSLSGGFVANMVLSSVLPSSSLAPTTIVLRAGPNSAVTMYINGNSSGGQFFGGVSQTGLIVIEVGA